eukprot:scaffold2096_cov145-Skeletonema_menzelii.AAC.7
MARQQQTSALLTLVARSYRLCLAPPYFLISPASPVAADIICTGLALFSHNMNTYCIVTAGHWLHFTSSAYVHT